MSGNGQDFHGAEATGWGEQDHPENPLTWDDLEKLLRFVQSIIHEEDYLSLDLILHMILDGGSQSEWARIHNVTPQAAHNRLRKARERSSVIATVLPTNKYSREISP